MPQVLKLSAASFLFSILWSVSALGQITPIGPFEGDLTDTFNHFSTNQAVQVLDVFDETSTLRNLSDGGAIKVEISSSLNGDLVTPRSGWMVGQLGIGQWDFPTPAVQLGGYFENNSGADDATLSFFDERLELIGTVTADIPAAGQEWVWNGWESAVPFSRVEVVGNGLINGFIWYEDMQLSIIPEPSTLSLQCLGLLAARRRR